MNVCLRCLNPESKWELMECVHVNSFSWDYLDNERLFHPFCFFIEYERFRPFFLLFPVFVGRLRVDEDQR